MKRFFLAAYLIVCISVFFLGVKTIYAKPGDFLECSKAFKTTCSNGGCPQTDRTKAENCKLKYCSAGCAGYTANGTCIAWNYSEEECTGGGGGGDWIKKGHTRLSIGLSKFKRITSTSLTYNLLNSNV